MVCTVNYWFNYCCICYQTSSQHSKYIIELLELQCRSNAQMQTQKSLTIHLLADVSYTAELLKTKD